MPLVLGKQILKIEKDLSDFFKNLDNLLDQSDLKIKISRDGPNWQWADSVFAVHGIYLESNCFIVSPRNNITSDQYVSRKYIYKKNTETRSITNLLHLYEDIRNNLKTGESITLNLKFKVLRKEKAKCYGLTIAVYKRLHGMDWYINHCDHFEITEDDLEEVEHTHKTKSSFKTQIPDRYDFLGQKIEIGQTVVVKIPYITGLTIGKVKKIEIDSVVVEHKEPQGGYLINTEMKKVNNIFVIGDNPSDLILEHILSN